AQLVDHRVDGLLQLEHLAARVDGDLLREVAGRHGSGDVGDVSHLVGEVGGHRVDAVRQVLPRPRYGRDVGLAAQFSFGSHLAGDAGDLVGERGELVDHRVDRVLELEDLAPRLDGDLLGEVACGDRGRDVGDVPHLVGQVGGHPVHALGQL